MNRHRLAIAAYLAIICIQFGVIIGFMVHFAKVEMRHEVMRIKLKVAQADATDWEQIATSYKQSSATYALSSERCLAAMRDYHRSMFQPVEMGK